MKNVCQKCIDAGEQLPDKIMFLPPDGCCIICWIRYGKFIPAAKVPGELKNEN